MICTRSTLSRGDFCFRAFCGWLRRYNLSSSVSVTVTSLIVGIWKVFKSMVSRDSERDVQPRPRVLTDDLRSLRSKIAPRKEFYLFARSINLDLTSKNTRWILNERFASQARNGYFLWRKERWFSRRPCACRLLHKFYVYRESFGLKVVASLFGLLAVLSRSHLGKTALQKSLNGLLFTVRKGRGDISRV